MQTRKTLILFSPVPQVNNRVCPLNTDVPTITKAYWLQPLKDLLKSPPPPPWVQETALVPEPGCSLVINLSTFTLHFYPVCPPRCSQNNLLKIKVLPGLPLWLKPCGITPLFSWRPQSSIWPSLTVIVTSSHWPAPRFLSSFCSFPPPSTWEMPGAPHPVPEFTSHP